MTWADVAWLLLVCLLAGGVAGSALEVRQLRRKLWRLWQAQDQLKRQLALEKAGRAHAAETYARRVARWRAYATDLQALRPGVPVAWLVVYEDGTSCVMRDDQRSSNHAAGAHGIRVALAPVLPEPVKPDA